MVAAGLKASKPWPAAISALVTAALVLLLQRRTRFADPSAQDARWSAREQPETLVIYAFRDTDFAALDNLRFFVREGMQPNDGCQYIIVVNGGEGQGAKLSDMGLPALPPSAKYVLYNDECSNNWGTFGWAIQQWEAELTDYEYFLFMDSSVRGPFIPMYASESVHFTKYFKAKLKDDVKLVGPTISCEPGMVVQNGTTIGAEKSPHVQSYAVMTDRKGLQVLRNHEQVLKCYNDRHEGMRFSELGSSQAILKAGYNIASFMPMYEGIDWREEKNSTWECGGMMNPYDAQYADRATLAPATMMFVKVNSGIKLTAASSTHKSQTVGWVSYAAQTMDSWLTAARKDSQEVAKNSSAKTVDALKMQRVLEAASAGVNCFDEEFYKASNPDLQLDTTAKDLSNPFLHYINIGQFAPRPVRLTCSVPASAVLPLGVDDSRSNVLWHHPGFVAEPIY